MPLSAHDVGPAQRGELLALFASADEYFRLTSGRPPNERDVEETLTVRPPAVDESEKHSLGLWDGARLVAFADVLRGYPSSAHAFIGLLLVDESRRGERIGTTLHGVVVERAVSWRGVQTMRLGVVEANAHPAAPFWRRLGYRPTGEEKPYANGEASSTTALWERALVQ